MKPLQITAHLQDVVSLTLGNLALDALLAALYAVVHRLPPVVQGVIPEPLQLPIAKEPGGRFDLASFSVACFDAFETEYFHKQFPHREAKHRTQMKRANIATGPNKSHRHPLSLSHPESDQLVWWCMGDKAGIEDLLQYCHHLGKKRSFGYGKVLEWTVADCDPWDGFPVVKDGHALRNLPPDWPGLVEPDLRLTRLTYPYWLNSADVCLCAVPEADV